MKRPSIRPRPLASLTWPEVEAAGAVAALARRSGLASRSSRETRDLAGWGEGPVPPHFLEERLAAAASALGLEVEPIATSAPEVERLLRCGGPAILQLPGSVGGGLLALAGCVRGALLVVAPDLRVHRLPRAAVLAAARAAHFQESAPEIEKLLDRAEARGRNRERLRAALADRERARSSVAGCWLLRGSPGSALRMDLRELGLVRHGGRFVVFYVISYGLLLASWWALGAGVLQGRLAAPWLAAWALVLLTLIPFRLMSYWSQSQLTVALGTFLKRRLLEGALRLQPEEIRHQGAGQLLGRVLESDAVETLILNGGFLTVVGLIEVALGGSVVFAGSAGLLHGLALLGWVAVTCALGWLYLRDRRRWTAHRIGMTHDLVERLVGYRTRLAQEPRGGWHEDEDRLLATYAEDSMRFDRRKAVLLTLMPRGWLLLSLCALVPAFASAAGTPVALALAVGGTLAAYRGFSKLSEGFGHLAGALISWQVVADLFGAASRPREEGTDWPAATAMASSATDEPLLEGLDLVFRHAGRPRPVLDGLSIRLQPADRVLLEGRSGSGKSTLASLLAGFRLPHSGLLLLGGLDRWTLGERLWRRRVALAPQFHENHVFTETLAFNLLMGRGWPPEPEDLAEAEDLCRELGLGDVLERMPSGLQQIVGETGWQLSHGERSRLFMARALLQRAEVVILDESLAALDPENFEQALDCALRRAPTLLVVGHTL